MAGAGASIASASRLEDGKAALAALCCSALLLSGVPAAQAGVVEDAIAEAADASYPILKAARPEVVAKLAGLVTQASPAELAKAVDLGLDVALSVPADKAGAVTTAV